MLLLLPLQTFHDGLREAGETSSVMLPRASYAGTSRYGAGLCKNRSSWHAARLTYRPTRSLAAAGRRW